MKRRSVRLFIRGVLVFALITIIAFAGIIVHKKLTRYAWRATRKSNIRIVFFMLHFYVDNADLRGKLPPAIARSDTGKPLSSWRLRIVHYWEAPLPDVDFSRSWDSAENSEMAKIRPGCYCLARWPDFLAWDVEQPDELHELQTNVFAITGQGTAFDSNTKTTLEELPGDLMILIEVANSGIHWMAPGDIHFDDISASTLKGVDGEGVYVVFADGEVWYLRKDVPLDNVRKFLTIESATNHNRKELLEPYRVAP